VTGEVGAVGVFQGFPINGGFFGLVMFEDLVGVKQGLDGFHFHIRKLEVFGGVLDGEEAVKVGALSVLGLLQNLAIGGVCDSLGKQVL
jgi:hypothetical protein